MLYNFEGKSDPPSCDKKVYFGFLIIVCWEMIAIQMVWGVKNLHLNSAKDVALGNIYV